MAGDEPALPAVGCAGVAGPVVGSAEPELRPDGLLSLAAVEARSFRVCGSAPQAETAISKVAATDAYA